MSKSSIVFMSFVALVTFFIAFIFPNFATAEVSTEAVIVKDRTLREEKTSTVNPLAPTSELYYKENLPQNDVGWIDGAPNDLLFVNQWGLLNTGQEFGGLLGPTKGTAGADINVIPVWDAGISGKNTIRVAVADTGANTTHKDLVAHWPSSFEGNFNYDASSTNVSDTNGHGTMVSGIIAATSNNEIGISGVAPGVQLYSFKTGAGPEISLSAVAKAFSAAKNNKIDVVNASIGGSYYKAIETAVLANPDTLFVVSSGNEGRNNDNQPTYPCALPAENILCVAATDADDALASFSNYGRKTVDIGAPGQDIISTYFGHSYAIFDGTSASAPFVAGAAALLKQKHPEYTPVQLKQTLLIGGKKISNLNGLVGSGARLDIGKSISLPKTVPPKTKVKVMATNSANRFGSTARFNFSSNESGVKFECQLNKVTIWTGCQKRLIISPGQLKAGKHELRVRAIDRTGLAGEVKTIIFSISFKKPTLKLGKARSTRRGINLKLKTKGATKVICSIKRKRKLRSSRCFPPLWKIRTNKKVNFVHVQAWNNLGNSKTVVAKLVKR